MVGGDSGGGLLAKFDVAMPTSARAIRHAHAGERTDPAVPPL
jgi:hypothetical protein